MRAEHHFTIIQSTMAMYQPDTEKTLDIVFEGYLRESFECSGRDLR